MSGSAVPVAVVIGSMNRGGTETHLAEVLPALKDHGFDPAVFVLGMHGPVADELRAKGIAVHPDRPMPAAPGVPLLRRLARLMWLVPRLFAFGFARRSGILHAFLPRSAILTFCLFWPWRARLLISQRGQFTYRALNWPLENWIERLALRHAAAVLTNCRTLEQMLRNDRSTPRRIHVITNGLSSARLSPGIERPQSRALLGLPPDTLAFVTLANLHPYKGHADVIRAFGLLRRRGTLPEQWRWIVIGDDPAPPLRPSLVALADAEGIAPHVQFLGPREDAPLLLPGADIGIHASHEEGMSNAVLEMMGAGLPIVATDAGGTAEALDNGQAGIIVPIASPDDLADAIENLLRNGELRQWLGAAARQRSQRVYDLAPCVAAYAEVYRAVIEPQ